MKTACWLWVLLPTVVAAAPVPSDELWSGTLHTGAIDLRLVVKLHHDPDGGLRATLASLDQGGQEMPAERVTFDKAELRFEMPKLAIEYAGKRGGDGKIHGTFTQRGTPLELVLEPVAKMPLLNRPQEPKRPFPYAELEVTVAAGAGVSLGGTLTVPPGKGPFAAALLVTGSGQQDRDESLFGHKPFLVLSDALTRRGIAVLRLDDRGVGKSTGDVARATTLDFADDAAAAVAFLRTRPEIDRARIGIIGHSEGGLIAPLVAAKRDDVAFLVLLAGTGLPGAQILESQSEAMVRASGGNEFAAKISRETERQVLAILVAEPDDEKALKRIQQITGKSDRAVVSPWFRTFVSLDPRPVLAKVRCPLLAVGGSLDMQVPSKENLPEIAKAVKLTKDVTTRELPGLNHLFQTAKTGALSEYGQIEETMSPSLLTLVGDWVVQKTKR